MRHSHSLTAALLLAASTLMAQQQAGDASRAVAAGGIKVSGWMGIVDPNEAKGGAKLEQALFAMDGNAMHATTGPAMTYYNPANKASGNYTVKATFTEPKYMNLNNHPHPYGIVIAGNDMGTDKASYLYCAAYGNGNFIVRGFGPDAFQVNGRREASAAIKKADAPGAAVTQEIAVAVKGDKVECWINGTMVGSYDKSALVAPGKLKSTDGVYGVRFGHNTEATVSNLTMTKN